MYCILTITCREPIPHDDIIKQSPVIIPEKPSHKSAMKNYERVSRNIFHNPPLFEERPPETVRRLSSAVFQVSVQLHWFTIYSTLCLLTAAVIWWMQAIHFGEVSWAVEYSTWNERWREQVRAYNGWRRDFWGHTESIWVPFQCM